MTERGDGFGEELYDEETLAAIESWSQPSRTGAPAGISGWRRTSASGAVLGAALLGLGGALETRRSRERPPIVVDDDGQPHDPDALVELDFDPASPAGTVAHVRTVGADDAR